MAYESTLKGGALPPLPREANSRFPVRPWDVLTHVLFLDCGKLGVFALEELSLPWRTTCPALSLPRRIPLVTLAQNPLDHVVLVGVVDGRE